jgi:flagellar motor switch protein FliM
VEPILSQEEIRELLAAIQSGAVPLDNDGESSGFRHCRPLNLFDAARRRETDSRIANFDLIVDAFARNYATALTNNLQRTCSIKRTRIEGMPFQEYVARNQKNPGGIGLFSLQPLRHSGLLALDSALSFSLVEIMLGAAGQLGGQNLDRELTTIELAILKSVIALAEGNLNRAFAPLINLKSTLERVERNMRMVSIAEAEADVIVAGFQLTMGDLSGDIDLVAPLAAIEPLRGKLKELLNVNVLTKNSWRRSAEVALAQVEATIIAQSGVISMAISDILTLKPGDIIPLDYDPNAPLKILVEDKVKFYAQAGESGGKKAVGITAVNM